ncbi:GNAT family N-acetyltransferase [Halobacillus mangrovi]|uniref:GNAT family N-acetyltransferase n=1 Tax=Halobacillus mangrovi TaxID=402384 RepID=A0A1W5ZRS8_9BACI|nr:GNAT family N-acetyltransferase [Halobacillus mangrovi]ARI75988.1 GNAT family N-acetyltransferase [Halobacillus mangrovi]
MEWIPMPQRDAEIIASWKYPEPYSFYDMTADEEDYEEFIQPEKRSNHVYSVYENGKLIGFFTFTPVDHLTVDIGLGLRPDLTGKGFGGTFLNEGIKFAERQFGAEHFSLSVAVFNKRAVEVYRRAGFRELHTFLQKTNGSEYEFVKMKKP